MHHIQACGDAVTPAFTSSGIARRYREKHTMSMSVGYHRIGLRELQKLAQTKKIV
jgi:hypothetical protein